MQTGRWFKCPDCGCLHMEAKPGKGGKGGDPPEGVHLHPVGKQEPGQSQQPSKPQGMTQEELKKAAERAEKESKELAGKSKDVEDLKKQLKEAEAELGKAVREEREAQGKEAKEAAHAKVNAASKKVSELRDKLAKAQDDVRAKWDAAKVNGLGIGDAGSMRIGMDGVDKNDLKAPPPDPMTVQDFKEEFRDYKNVKIGGGRNSCLDPRRIAQIPAGCEDPFLQTAEKRLSDVHLVLCPDSSGSMQGWKCATAAKCVSLMQQAAQEINDEGGPKFDITVIKWDDCATVIKQRDESVTEHDIGSRYTHSLGGGTDISPLVDTIDKDVPVQQGETCIVMIFSDGAMNGQDKLEAIMGNDGRIWILVGIQASNTLFNHVIKRPEEMEDIIVRASLEAIRQARGG